MSEMSKRESWGTKNYDPKDKEIYKRECKHSRPTDKYGTPQAIANAVHFYLDYARAQKSRMHDNRDVDTYEVILKCQQGKIVNEFNPLHYDEKGIYDHEEPWGKENYNSRHKRIYQKKCKQSCPMDTYGTPQEIANAVHHNLDWLRASGSRPSDHRSPPSAVTMLEICQRGTTLNSATHLHYDEEPERR